jgi:hypothetical protein
VTEATDVVKTEHPAPADNPFRRGALAEHVNAGAVTIESDRAVAEAQGKLILAKKFPRDEARAYSAIIQACSRRSLAEVSMYAFPRGGQSVTGPSIRLAEELARCWGNMSYGTRELSRKEGVSEMEAFAWDEETNVRSVQQFTVRHIRDTRSGGVRLTDERDIYELTANQAARRLRARILAILPPDIVEAAIEQCRKTVTGASDEPIAARIRKMVVAFAKFGVTAEQIEKRLGHPIDETTPDDIADLTGIFTSLRDGQTKAADWFGANATQGDGVPRTRAAVLDAVAATAKTQDATSATQEPAQGRSDDEPSGGSF